MGEEGSRELIRGTTITAYRRVHEIAASVFDRALVLKGVDRDAFQRMVQELLVELGKALILVRYQRARRQLSEGLATNLELLIGTAINSLKESVANLGKVHDHRGVVENVVNTLIRARTLLDALATLVYAYGK